MSLLVTGATGFIGRHLVEALLKQGEALLLLVRDKAKCPQSFQQNALICQADLKEPELPSLKGVEGVFHLGAEVNYFGSWKELYRVNVEGSLKLFKLSLKAGVKRFILVSSGEAGGLKRKDRLPAKEEEQTRLFSPYARSKFLAEQALLKLAKNNGIELVILRPSNVYGPGSGFLVLEIARAIRGQGKLLSYLEYLKGRYIHPVYIEDLVLGMLTAYQKGKPGEIYHLSGKVYLTLGEFTALLSELLKIPLNKIKPGLREKLRCLIGSFFPPPNLLGYFLSGRGGLVHRAYSPEKAEKQLGYQPLVMLPEGIQKTLQWAESSGKL